LGAILSKINGTENSHNDLNRTEDDVGLTESFSTSTELHSLYGQEFKIVFEILLIFKN
jgi:hypothetical protein